ncbi:2-amino-4-hydroxy-6-hydroxymethyldihydropteridine diphosphokinase [Azospirillum sp. TSO22-1]|uniref:2-amino-4-hydroxy-6- hydroxymethyldihydropteridine diphosphokinase n=1 Tax=Azospirillum sp. TSO22-1 TaxID=716789 RepID=UPI000D6222EA|nr:2-amino-4-hydroxy-6-hydroxymethyldihydropteridine diphosphokinase [Azospirillum sp. TSO22-1]PWC44797.1 2-amino-4-hydroxy-6-hydroxymethyldihydropteridine pyrophosphokinase [Azospirillum sp. TSO22-1]
MTTVCIALGSNLGDRLANLEAAIARLAPAVAVTARSAVYETAPMYVTDQPAFLNMAVRGETDLAPEPLLAHLKGIEAALGRRDGGVRFGPREVDLDILLYGDAVSRAAALEIPHPRMAERAFVLRPLADVAAEVRHPVLGRTIAELLAEVPGADTVVRLG